jgi:hypothetical protein
VIYSEVVYYIYWKLKMGNLDSSYHLVKKRGVEFLSF